MLQYLSWGDYFTFISFLTIMYYSGILLLYYRKELSNCYKNGFASYRKTRRSNDNIISRLPDTAEQNLKGGQSAEEPAGGFEGDQQSFKPDPFDDKHAIPDKSTLFPYVHELMDETSQVLKTANSKKYIKEELIIALQMKISKYPMLEGTVFKTTVNSFLAIESRKACSVSFSENELERLWKKGK